MKIRVLAFLLLFVITALFLFFSMKSNFHDIDEFGLEYNNFRAENNIPKLKSNWKINDKKALFEYYEENANKNGHIKKFINLSTSDVGSERDVFKVDTIIFYSLYERNDKNKVIYKIKNNELSTIFQSQYVVISAKEANAILEKSNTEFRFNNSWSRE